MTDDGSPGPETLEVFNPADDTLLGTVPLLDRNSVREAIDAAAKALPSWAARTAADRSAVLMRLHDLILLNLDELAKILTAEQGKPLAEARDEIRYGASYIEWFAEEAKRAYGEIIPSPTPDKRLFVLRQPVGVVAAITPWNFPCAMITQKNRASFSSRMHHNRQTCGDDTVFCFGVGGSCRTSGRAARRPLAS